MGTTKAPIGPFVVKASPQGERPSHMQPYKPDSVESSHPSGTHVAACLVRPTRRHRTSSPRTPPYSALHRVGFAWPSCHHDAGALLPHHFTVASGDGVPSPECCVISVALSRGSPRLDVIQHPALRCPDFPRWARRRLRRPPTATTRAAAQVYQRPEPQPRLPGQGCSPTGRSSGKKHAASCSDP